MEPPLGPMNTASSKSLLAKWRAFLQVKRNFVRFGTVAFGIVCAMSFIPTLAPYGGIVWLILWIAICFVAGWIYARLMWIVFTSMRVQRPKRDAPPPF